MGRQHVYSITSKAVANALQGIRELAHSLPDSFLSQPKVRSRAAQREVKLDSQLRHARTCYDHLAGVAGVELLREMLRRGWIEERKLRSEGRERVLYDLTDWTERRYHLGGLLGNAILQKLLEKGIVVKAGRGSRALNIRNPITNWLAM
jgi:hypothetical protein